MKIVLILAVSLSLVNGNINRQEIIKSLQHYINRIGGTCSNSDPDGSILWWIVERYKKEGVICERAFLYYADLNNGILQGYPVMLARKVLWDQLVYDTIQRLQFYIHRNVPTITDNNGKLLLGYLRFTDKEGLITKATYEDNIKFWDTPTKINENLINTAMSILYDLLGEIANDIALTGGAICQHKQMESIKQIIEYQEKYKNVVDKNGVALWTLLNKFKENGEIGQNAYDKYLKDWNKMKSTDILAADVLLDLSKKNVACENGCGGPGLAKFQDAIKQLEAYIEKVNHNKDELWTIISGLRHTGLRKEYLQSCESVWRERLYYNPKRFAELLVKELRLDMAVKQLIKYQENYPNNEDPDGTELWKLLNEFKKNEVVTTADYKEYERLQTADGLKPYQLADHVEKDIGGKIVRECKKKPGNENACHFMKYYKRSIEDINVYIRKMEVSHSAFDPRGSHLLLILYSIHKAEHNVICLKRFRHYEFLFNVGFKGKPLELAKIVLMDIKLDMALKLLKAYRITNTIVLHDEGGVGLWMMLSKFVNEGIIAKEAYKHYELRWKGHLIDKNPRILVNDIITDLEKESNLICENGNGGLPAIRYAIELLDDFINDDSQLPTLMVKEFMIGDMLQHFKDEGVILKGPFDKYIQLWKGKLHGYPKKLAKIVLKDLRLGLAIEELKEFLKQYDPNGDKIAASKELSELLDGITKNEVISTQEYDDYKKKYGGDPQVLATEVLKDLEVKKGLGNGKKP